MKTILSTKKLNYSQKERLLAAGLAVVDVDFIATETIPFTCEAIIENAIFTSKKGVQAVFDKGVTVQNAYCVGKRTAALIKSYNSNVHFEAKNAAVLSDWIIAKVSHKSFHYFCAKDRLDTLPDKLTSFGVDWLEIPVYKTLLTPKRYVQEFDGVLFFSPSGVRSFFRVNTYAGPCFCIGNTTGSALSTYTNNYTVATENTVENVLVKAIKYFKND